MSRRCCSQVAHDADCPCRARGIGGVPAGTVLFYERQGAARERRRIRRAQACAIKRIQEKRKGMWGTKASAWLLDIVHDIDKPTRTPKKARTR